MSDFPAFESARSPPDRINERELAHEIDARHGGGTGDARLEDQRLPAAAVFALLRVRSPQLDGLGRAHLRAGWQGRLEPDLDDVLRPRAGRRASAPRQAPG